MAKKDKYDIPWWASNSYAALVPDKVSRYTIGSVFSSVAVVLVLVAVIGWTIWGVDPSRPKQSQFEGGMEYPATVEAVLNQCGNTFAFEAAREHYGVFSSKDLQESLLKGESYEIPTHPMIVPVYGYMSEEPADEVFEQKMYKHSDAPTRSQLLRAMWDGAVVVWHSPAISNEEEARLSMSIRPYDNIIAVEWAGGELPLGRKYAFSTWGISQSCQNWDEEVFSQFLSFIEEHPQYTKKGQEPPEAILTDEGLLHDIDPARI